MEAPNYESGGQEFESLRARQKFKKHRKLLDGLKPAMQNKIFRMAFAWQTAKPRSHTNDSDPSTLKFRPAGVGNAMSDQRSAPASLIVPLTPTIRRQGLPLRQIKAIFGELRGVLSATCKLTYDSASAPGIATGTCEGGVTCVRKLNPSARDAYRAGSSTASSTKLWIRRSVVRVHPAVPDNLQK